MVVIGCKVVKRRLNQYHFFLYFFNKNIHDNLPFASISIFLDFFAKLKSFLPFSYSGKTRANNNNRTDNKMAKGKRYGCSISVKANGMRAIAGQTGVVKRGINQSNARENMMLEQMKESLSSKPSKDNMMNSRGGKLLSQINETLVNKSTYQELRKVKDMSKELTKKIEDALENMEKEKIKSQDDINNYIASVVGGKQGELMKKMLEITLGK